MKRLISIILSAIILAGCTNMETDIPEPGPGGEEDTGAVLGINGLNLSVDTKSIIEGVGNDGAGNHLSGIGVMVTKLNGTKVSFYSQDIETQEFHYNGTDWTADVPLNLANSEGTVYAWAPLGYDAAIKSSVPVVQGLPILAAQSFNVNGAGNEWDTEQEDLLYGSAADTPGDETHQAVDKWNHTVDNMYMQHALAKVSFRIRKASGQVVNSDDYVKKMELTSVTGNTFAVSPRTSKVTMNLTDGAFGALTTASSLTFTAEYPAQLAVYSADYSSVTHAQAYGLVAPATVGAMRLKMTLGPDGLPDATTDRTYETRADDTSLQNVVWQKGRHYVYTLTATDQGLEITNVEVVGWDDAGTTEVPVE